MKSTYLSKKLKQTGWMYKTANNVLETNILCTAVNVVQIGSELCSNYLDRTATGATAMNKYRRLYIWPTGRGILLI
jgi:hypothetical protein